MKYIILITGASSGFGELTARALAKAGHIVYASMRETVGRTRRSTTAPIFTFRPTVVFSTARIGATTVL